MPSTEEPDDIVPTDAQASAARDSDEARSPRPTPAVKSPDRKPPVPETGADANSMDRLMSGVSSSLKNSNNLVNASSLNVDHPYGDGQHTETASDTLARLGAGKKYGE